MRTATTEAGRRSAAPVRPVGELLYRFEAELEVTPVGLTPEGIRMTVDYEHVRAYCVPPQGLEVPPPEVILDPSFSWPDVDFPILGFSTFRAGNPEYGHLNTTIAAIEGWANFATGRNAIETRVLSHSGSAAPPRRSR